MNLKTWVNGQRGRSLAIAQALGVTPPVVSDWVTGKKRIPAEQCPKIEEYTGIRCEDLRPDVRWDVLRGNAAPQAAQGV